MKLNIAIIGARGKMGASISKWLNDHTLILIHKENSLDELTNIDLAIEVTNSEHVLKNTQNLLKLKIPTIVGASGIKPSDYERLSTQAETACIPLWIIPNFSISAILMMMCAQKIAHHYSHCHIIEMHHPQKLDAPSGTAKHTAWLIESTGGPKTQISSIRSPGIIADQHILFATMGETLTIKHHTESRECYKPGVLMAVNHILQLSPKLHIGLEFLLSL